MSKFDPTRFKVLRRSPAGKISVKELNNGAVQVETGSAYTVIDTTTGKLASRLQAKRVGQDLQISVDGDPLIRLEGFYLPGNGNTAFDGSGELFSPGIGQYDSGYSLLTGDPVGTTDKVLIGPGEQGLDSSGLLWGGAIGLAGAAAAFSGKSGSYSSLTTSTGGTAGGTTGGTSGGTTGGTTGGSTGGTTGG